MARKKEKKYAEILKTDIKTEGKFKKTAAKEQLT